MLCGPIEPRAPSKADGRGAGLPVNTIVRNTQRARDMRTTWNNVVASVVVTFHTHCQGQSRNSSQVTAARGSCRAGELRATGFILRVSASPHPQRASSDVGHRPTLAACRYSRQTVPVQRHRWEPGPRDRHTNLTNQPQNQPHSPPTTPSPTNSRSRARPTRTPKPYRYGTVLNAGLPIDGRGRFRPSGPAVSTLM